MEIIVFGKKLCSGCQEVKEKLTCIANEKEYKDKLKICFYDMDTVDGLSEGAFHDVGLVPTTIFKKEKDVIARWDGIVPEDAELKKWL